MEKERGNFCDLTLILKGVYSAHGEDAQTIALEYYKNSNYLKSWGKAAPVGRVHLHFIESTLKPKN